MRALSYILVIAGLWLLGAAGYQQYRGVTDKPVMTGGALIVSGGEIVRTRSPEAFRGAMTFHWFYACATVFMGVVLYLIVRRQDRLDPFSPDFDWKDEKGDT